MTTFEQRRFANFLRFEFASRRGEFTLPLLAPIALYLLVMLVRFSSGAPAVVWPSGIFSLGLFLGLGTAAGVHQPLHEQNKAPFYLLLPASHTERFWAHWLLSFGLSFFGLLAALMILANVFATFSWLTGHGFSGPVMPSLYDFLGAAGAYLTLHSLFFAGGVFFRRHAIVKTLLATLAFAAAIFIVLGVSATAGLFVKTSFDFANMGHLEGQISTGATTAILLLRLAWQVVFPALLYAATYFRLKEFEVRG